MKKKITIFGSTGSIGRNTIDIISKSPEKYQVIGLFANNNYQLLAEQAILLKAQHVCIYNEQYYTALQDLLSGHNIKIHTGETGIVELCSKKNDLVVAAIVGAAGLISTYHAIINGSNIALANKESLVCAGNLMIDAAKKHKVKLLPTDSEHNAIFQIFDEANRSQITKIILTASGGPFLNIPIEEMDNILPEQAIKHPNWNMGKKITVDSATMVNKGLELIEAYYLFDFPVEKLDVLIHPQSIIHSMVCYKDGSTLAQLGNPDMRTPISYALDWPNRPDKEIVKPLDLIKIGQLTFLSCDIKKFPAVQICKELIKEHGNSKIIFNAANELAVENFLNNKIRFTDINKINEKMIEYRSSKNINSIEEVIAIDKEYRIKTQEYIDKHNWI
jgi:1-deoxy-D-xylulose-5-phosphate reductoisomerase